MDFMKVSWLFANFILLYLINLTTGEEPKVIIIGAGPAGIAAASRLYEYGFKNITILEAEGRIGGRIHTTWFDGSWIDLGAQWVHGEMNNTVFQLASPLGILEIPNEEENTIVYDSEGSQIPNSITNDFFEMFYRLQANSRNDFRMFNISIGDYLTNMITIEAARFPAAYQPFIKQFLQIFEGYTNSLESSDSWFNDSARESLEHWICPETQHINWKDGGYAVMLDILMHKYPNPENELPVLNNTILNTEVVNIDSNPMGGEVLVESRNGTKYSADHVIVTPSLGVLKEQYETLFAPELPEYKVKTIKNLAMGTVGKIFLSFEEGWWPNDHTSFTLMWNETLRQEYKNNPHNKWLLDLYGFLSLPRRPRILMGWVNGAGARYMETLSEDQVLHQTFELLNKFLGKSYNISKPTGILRSKWYSRKHFRGTYSFRSMESVKADVSPEDLATPLIVNGKPIVMFAGEATHSHSFATVHGAIETGFREAKRLMDVYNKSIPLCRGGVTSRGSPRS